MRQIAWLAAGALAAGSLFATVVAATAQDVVTVAPSVYKKVLENNRIRVLQGTFKPGAKVGLHSHPDHLLYVLTDGSLTFKPTGRTPFEMTFNAGEAFSLPAQTRAAENDGDKDVRVLVVELKQSAAAPASAKAGKRGKRAAKSVRKRRR